MLHDDISLEAKDEENEDDPAPSYYLSVYTRRVYYQYLPQLVECDKKIAYWKDLEIELVSDEKKKLEQEILSKQEEAQKLRGKLKELQKKKC
ncbi:hypothetical protein CTI12_AA108360 [Artemisia annua]|uniref:Uncharacterized protein n=1 Tax=Artemisia annua TaxID=35608 RepID=A0A2U1PVE8_ARTAN|nr:hypothetical protein CTI12_AA108360 [Artemisia annua]